MREEIRRRFGNNVGRVQSLIDTYAAHAPSGSGRPAVATADLLRAAVVFAHAALEDLIRSVLAWKLPAASPEHLADIPLVGKKPRTKITLDELAQHRGKTVEQLVIESVEASLLKSNYNKVSDIKTALEKIGLPSTLLDPVRDKLGPLMQRRHWIVHRADRNEVKGSGHHATRSLQQSAVEKWLQAIEKFGADVLNSL